MSYEQVDFYVKDSTPAANPIEGVLVKIYSESGALFYTQGITASDGKAGFLLDTLTYSARFYKFQVAIQQPQVFEVKAPPDTNVFDIVGDVFVLPVATDPRFCRASGYFRTVAGGPHRNVDLHFLPHFNHLVLDDAAILDSKVISRTDENGYIEIDLIRGAEYNVLIQGSETEQRIALIPDSPSVNIGDLILPVVEKVTLDPVGPYSLAVNAEQELTPVVISSDGRPLSPATAPQDVIWSSSDPTIMSVTATDDKVTIRGLAAGTAELQVERRDQSIVVIPDAGVLGQPVEVTVS